MCTLKCAVASFSCQDGQYKGSKHAMHCMLCMSTLSTLVFVGFTQPCILCVQGPFAPPGGKTCCQSHVFCGSSVQRSSFANFLGLVNYKGDCSKTHSQSPILKTKGVLSNLLILKCKERSCILHTVRLPAYMLKIQKVLFNA